MNSKEPATEILVERGWLAPATSSDTNGKKRKSISEPEDVEMEYPSENSQELSKVHYINTQPIV